MAKDIDQTPAGRRDRGLGEDRGQHGALHSQDRTQPNKSAMGAKDAPALCSIPWSMGRIDKYPVLAKRPAPNNVCKLRSTWVFLLVGINILSTKSGLGV